MLVEDLIKKEVWTLNNKKRILYLKSLKKGRKKRQTKPEIDLMKLKPHFHACDKCEKSFFNKENCDNVLVMLSIESRVI